jgi:hypothetical protein
MSGIMTKPPPIPARDPSTPARVPIPKAFEDSCEGVGGGRGGSFEGFIDVFRR